MKNIIKLLNQYVVSFELLGQKYAMPILQFCEKYGEDYTKSWSEVVQYLNEELITYESDGVITYQGGDWLRSSKTGVEIIDAFYTLEIVNMALMMLGNFLIEKSYNTSNTPNATLTYEWRGKEINLTVIKVNQ